MGMMHKRVNLKDRPDYEDRVSQLLGELETKTKDHLAEISSIHDHYRN
jgi:hypothetical protein